jgi:hypothetical protein
MRTVKELQTGPSHTGSTTVREFRTLATVLYHAKIYRRQALRYSQPREHLSKSRPRKMESVSQQGHPLPELSKKKRKDTNAHNYLIRSKQIKLIVYAQFRDH